MDDPTETRLARWSRLKQETRRRGGGAAPVEAALPAAPPDAPPDVDGEAPAPPDLPSIDDLDGDSDYTPFLGGNVPEEITRLALRKLWRTDPVFANLDGLNDYDEDFTIVEAIKTAVQEVASKTEDAPPGDRDRPVAEAESDDEGDAETEPRHEPDAEPDDEPGPADDPRA